MRVGPVIAAVVWTAASTACGGVRGGVGVLPSEDDLWGLWVELDDDTWRAWEFAPPAAFELMVYPDGALPQPVMRGAYRTAFEVLDGGDEVPALLQEVIWAADEAYVGETFGNEIVRFDGDVLELDGSTGVRAFDRVDALP